MALPPDPRVAEARRLDRVAELRGIAAGMLGDWPSAAAGLVLSGDLEGDLEVVILEWVVLDLRDHHQRGDAVDLEEHGLPHLQPLTHGVAKILRVQATRQVRKGKIDDALVTLRLGYELSDKIGHEPIVVSGLVSIGAFGWMNEPLARGTYAVDELVTEAGGSGVHAVRLRLAVAKAK